MSSAMRAVNNYRRYPDLDFIFLFLKILFIYLFEREREHTHMHKRALWAQKVRENLPKQICEHRAQHGFQSHDPKIST